MNRHMNNNGFIAFPTEQFNAHAVTVYFIFNSHLNNLEVIIIH